MKSIPFISDIRNLSEFAISKTEYASLRGGNLAAKSHDRDHEEQEDPPVITGPGAKSRSFSAPGRNL